MSGIRVVYNLTQPSYARVHSVEVLCCDCDVPQYVPLDLFKQYRVIVNEFMSLGGHGYTMFTVNAVHNTLQIILKLKYFYDQTEKRSALPRHERFGSHPRVSAENASCLSSGGRSHSVYWPFK